MHHFSFDSNIGHLFGNGYTQEKNECLCLTYFSLWIVLKDVFEEVGLLVTEDEHFYEILFFKRQASPHSPRQCSTVLGSRRAGIWCYRSAFSGQVELLWRQLSLLISAPLVMVELRALPEPLCVFCLAAISFLWEAQCWWFVYFTYFHRFLNNLVRWARWLYYTYCKYCFIFIFEFILSLLCVLCLQLCRDDHLGVRGEAEGWHKESSLIAHYVLWDTVSQWSWSLLFCLDWLARESPVLGLYMCTTMPSFTWILQRKLRSSFNPTPNFWFK